MFARRRRSFSTGSSWSTGVDVSHPMVRRHVSDRQPEILAASGKALVEASVSQTHLPGQPGQGRDRPEDRFRLHFGIESFCCQPGVEGTRLTARGVTSRPASGQPRETEQPAGAGPEGRSLSPEEVVRHPARAGNDVQVEPVEQLIGGLPES